MALALLRAGCSVTAIDPRAPDGPIVGRVEIEGFSESGSFGCVVASLSLPWRSAFYTTLGEEPRVRAEGYGKVGMERLPVLPGPYAPEPERASPAYGPVLLPITA